MKQFPNLLILWRRFKAFHQGKAAIPLPLIARMLLCRLI